MRIILNNSSMIPIYEQLVSQIKNAVIAGQLKEGDPLPSVRTLAADLKISSLTVKKAYDKLEEQGFVITVHGKGSYIAGTDTEMAMEARKLDVENALGEALSRARELGMTVEEIRAIVDILLEER